MKTSDSPLTEPDVIPFYKKKVVVRLYKRQRWFAGFCWKIRFAENPDEPCHLWVNQYATLGLGHEALPVYPDTCLFSRKDWIIPNSIRIDERPFRLFNCRQIFTKRPYSGLLICSFSDGAMVLSERMEDIVMVNEHLGLQPAELFDQHIRLH